MKKIKLVEKGLQYIPKKDDVVILKENKITESLEGVEYPCRGILKNVPVTNFKVNANDRRYPKELWNKVLNDGSFEGSKCFTNHAENDNDVRQLCGIWHNFKVLDDMCIADLYCIGEYGSLMLEAIKGGSKRESFSTVGYGVFTEDNQTVEANSYEYTNTDWVDNQSCEIAYATQENLINEPIEDDNQTIDNSIQEKKSDFSEKVITNNKDSIVKESKDEVKKMDKMSEMNHVNHVTFIIKEAKKNENYLEALQTLKETAVSSEVEGLQAKVDSAISEIENKIHEEKVATSAKLEETTVSKKQLQEKYEKAVDTLTDLKEAYNKSKKIVEKAQDIIKEKNTLIKSLKEDQKNMKADINQFVKDRKNMLLDIKDFKEDRMNMKEDIKVLVSKYNEKMNTLKTIKKQLSFAEKRISVYEKILEDNGYEFEDEDIEVVDDSVEDFDDVVDTDLEMVDTEIEEEDEIDIEDEEMIFDDEEDDFSEEDEDDMEIDDFESDEEDDYEMEESPIHQMQRKRMKNEDETDFEDIDDEDEDISDLSLEEEDEEEIIAMGDEDEEDIFEESKNSKKSKNKKMKKSFLKSEIKKMIITESKKTPAIKDFTKTILKSESFAEAVSKIDRIKNSKKKSEKPLKGFSESTIKKEPEWAKGRI